MNNRAKKIAILLVIFAAVLAAALVFVLINFGHPSGRLPSSSPLTASSTAPRAVSASATEELWPSASLQNLPAKGCVLKNGRCEVKDAQGRVIMTSEFFGAGFGDLNNGGQIDAVVVIKDTYASSSISTMEMLLLSQDNKNLNNKISITGLSNMGVISKFGQFYDVIIKPEQREADIDIFYPKTGKEPARIQMIRVFTDEDGKLTPESAK